MVSPWATLCTCPGTRQDAHPRESGRARAAGTSLSTITTYHMPAELSPTAMWPRVARHTLAWLDSVGAVPRDAVLVLPFAELLPPCRRALAAEGGWMPRVETLRTLAASLGPAEAPAAESPSGDRALDQLLAERWLASLPGLCDWRGRDPAAHAQAIADVVDAAHALMRAAAGQSPPQRADWWAAAALALPATDGPGAREAALGRLAVHWASLSAAPATDRLHDLAPSAWVVLQAGGRDGLAEALMQRDSDRGVPCLRLVADADMADPFEAHSAAAPRLAAVPSMEDEAWAGAAAVIDAVSGGDTPVALIAQDRLLVRRIRALLERCDLRVADESGWALSTTRAASHLMALLRATRPAAGPDAWLDGLKACAAPGATPWLDQLERHWRRAGIEAPAGGGLDASFERWQTHRTHWQAFAAPQRQSLKRWLQALSELATTLLPASFWAEDPVAERVRAALRLDQASVRGDVDGLALSLDDFIAWVGRVLEQATYIAPVSVDAAQVVITPLARAILRPFGAVVLPGADERQLGVPQPAPELLPEASLRAMGMDDATARQQRAALGFTQLLRHPKLLLLRRRAEGSEPVGSSRWVDRLQAARALRGLAPLPESEAPLHLVRCLPQPTAQPAPIAAQALPDAVSATAVEALRACPYRFFARAVLRLSEAEELEADPGKRDFGSLLHEALYRFHETRDAAGTPEAQCQHLVALARASAARAGLDGPAMLPFAAGLAAFAERYLVWLLARDAEGWQYQCGETDMLVAPVGLDGLRLRGRIDRIDRQRGGAVQVIDYKTGSAAGLRDKLRDPLEDTQLAFYAAQVLSSEPVPPVLSALYVALDDRQAIETVLHPEVTASAQALLNGLARDWQRLRQGAALRALGEGMVCDNCEARGLCRRDHWAAPALDAIGFDGPSSPEADA